MSQENVEVVREALEAYSTGGVEALLDVCPPDVVLYPIPEWVEDSVYRGHEGVRKLVAWLDDFDDPGWEIHEIREVRDRVLVRADLTGRMKASGVPIRQAWGVVCSGFRDGMVGEWRFFRTWQEALEAVGLAK
jgi:ketosteroid isomerase-like protein